MAGKAHQMWRTNCDCGDCSYCNGISYPSGGVTAAQRFETKVTTVGDSERAGSTTEEDAKSIVHSVFSEDNQ